MMQISTDLIICMRSIAVICWADGLVSRLRSLAPPVCCGSPCKHSKTLTMLRLEFLSKRTSEDMFFESTPGCKVASAGGSATLLLS